MARLLGLPFPGGPHIDRAAASGSSVAIDFPRGLTSRRDLERHRFDFSFSGLKTAVARWVEARERSGEPVPVADVAASFQEAVCDVLVRKALDAATSTGVEDLLIGGGVAANSRLRAMAEERAAAVGVRVRVPRPGLCTDNGAMVAALGAEMVARGRTPSALDLPADSSQPVTSVAGLGLVSNVAVDSRTGRPARNQADAVSGRYGRRRRRPVVRSTVAVRSRAGGPSPERSPVVLLDHREHVPGRPPRPPRRRWPGARRRTRPRSRRCARRGR